MELAAITFTLPALVCSQLILFVLKYLYYVRKRAFIIYPPPKSPEVFQFSFASSTIHCFDKIESM